MEFDVVILCPDGAWPQALGAILDRHQSLGIRALRRKFVLDPLRDSSPQAVELLRPYQGASEKVMVVRDFHGSGWEDLGIDTLKDRLREQLQAGGWNPNDFEVIVADPELETWLRIPSPHLRTLVEERARKNRDQISRWRDEIEQVLKNRGGLNESGKPKAPKEVFRDFLSFYGIPPSNALFEYLGKRESLHRCASYSFLQFVGVVRGWFPAS